MSSQPVLLPATGSLATLKRHAHRLMEEGDGEVIFEFRGNPDPDRIVKFLAWADDEYKVDLVIAHAELEEVVTCAMAGGAVGAGLALAAKALGYAVSGPMVLASITIGALAGALSSTLHVKVYRYRGRTRIRLQAD